MSLNKAEFLYLVKCAGISESLRRMIVEHNLSKKDFCEAFGIKPRDYEKFVSGHYNYDLRDLAKINAVFMQLEIERLKKEVPIQMTKK